MPCGRRRPAPLCVPPVLETLTGSHDAKPVWGPKFGSNVPITTAISKLEPGHVAHAETFSFIFRLPSSRLSGLSEAMPRDGAERLPC